jgi:hypothetical protein
VLVTTSSESQDDTRLVEVALEALAEERFIPHRPVLGRAACAVTHGGMGATQKALAHGVPVCAVPFGRDQLEVARRVEVAGGGIRRRRRAVRRRRSVREPPAAQGAATEAPVLTGTRQLQQAPRAAGSVAASMAPSAGGLQRSHRDASRDSNPPAGEARKGLVATLEEVTSRSGAGANSVVG